MTNKADTPVVGGPTTITAVNSDVSEPDNGPQPANASQQPDDDDDDPNATAARKHPLLRQKNDPPQPPLLLMDEAAPLEREAGLQILKAWQELERKAAAKQRILPNTSDKVNDEEEEGDDLFLTLEEDDDVVLHTRLAAQAEDDELDDEQDEEEAEVTNEDGQGQTTVHQQPDSPIKDEEEVISQRNGSSRTTGESIRTFESERSNNQKPRSNKTQPNPRHRKPTHKRAESVENAMFGLLPLLPTTMNNISSHNAQPIHTPNNQKPPKERPENNLTNVMSSKNQMSYESPLLATNQLIDTAQFHVEDVRSKEKQQQQKGEISTKIKDPIPLSLADSSESNREQEFNNIIQVKGDGKSAGKNDGQQPLDDIDEEEEDDSEEDVELGPSNGTAYHDRSGQIVAIPSHRKRKSSRRHKRIARSLATGMHQDWELFQQFLTPRKATLKTYLKVVLGIFMLPSFLIAALLFYLMELPQQQFLKANGIPVDENIPNVSWFFLFIGVRQAVTLSLALATQAVVIDYLALGSRFSLKYLGPATTLLAVQARGWPCILLLWSIYDLILLSGNHAFAKNWGYFQNWVDLFNSNNRSGNVVHSEWNYRVLIMAAVTGLAVAIKRVLVGLFLARKTLSQFGEGFELLKSNMILVGELATLGMEIELSEGRSLKYFASEREHSVSSTNMKVIQATLTTTKAESDSARKSQRSTSVVDAASTFVKQWNSTSGTSSATTAKTHCTDGKADDFDAREQAKLEELLNEWEGAEDRLARKKSSEISIGSILRFYKEITVMQRKYPFLPVFGRSDTRENCFRCSQKLFDRLLRRTPSMKKLPFSTIALLAKDDSGLLDKQKLKKIISVFRPDRDGKLSRLDFIRSIDAVYKSLRQLSMNIEDNSQIDKVLSAFVDMVFYTIAGFVVLQVLGAQPSKLFVSLSAPLLAAAFLYGGSLAKYVEGILFILVQRPYGVGDRVHLSSPSSETNMNGSSGWIVEKVTLTTTTVYWGATGERATLSNGAISNLRVINANRSPKATVYVQIKFSIDTHHRKIQVFKGAAEQFLKQRPREWAAFLGFRPTEVAFEQGYTGYILIAQHRESWQKIGAILGSKAKLTTYLLEVSKQLDMRYVCPPLPVNIKIQDAKDALKAARIQKYDVEQGERGGARFDGD